jgi:putative nucleotidyltransferase with HDIG domain
MLHPRLIKDAIHDSIELSDVELAVIDSPLFQRLRFVRQLSTAYLVYPSAMHTRFEHSLGAMHLTGVLARRLGFPEGKVRALRLAALLHDIGHGAFAHVSDPLLQEKTGKMHETRGLDLVRRSGLKEIVEDAGVSLKELSRLMEGNDEGAIITRDLGTDRIDYLLRDAHFTGVAYSTIDADRLLHTMAYRKGELFVEERGMLAAESLLVSRHFMFKAVYYHPTVRISGEMVAQAMREALADGRIALNDIAQGSDERLLYTLEAAGSDLARRLLERRLFKSAYSVDFRRGAGALATVRSAGFRKRFAKHMEENGFMQDDYLVSLPDRRESHFSAKVLLKDGRTTTLDQASGLVRALEAEGPESPLIVACKPGLREKVAKASKAFFSRLR